MTSHDDIINSVHDFINHNDRIPIFICFNSDTYDNIRKDYIKYMHFSERSLIEKYAGMTIEINYNQQEDFTLR